MTNRQASTSTTMHHHQEATAIPHTVSMLLQQQQQQCCEQPREQEATTVHPPHLNRICSLNNMGVVSMQQMKFEEAELYLRKALRIAPNSDGYFFAMDLGLIDNSNSKNVVSDPCEEEDDDDLRDHPQKARYLFQREQYDEGISFFTEPFAVTTEASFCCVQTTLLYNLGQVLVRLHEDEEALKCFKQALQTLHQAFEASRYSCGQAHPSIIGIMMNIVRIHYINGRHEEAIPLCREALDFARNNYKENNTDILLAVSSILNCLGVLYFHIPPTMSCSNNSNDNVDRAMTFYRESLAIRRAVLGGQSAVSKEIATTLNNIGRVYFVRGEHDIALQAYHEALTMRRQLFGNNNLDVAASIYNAGQTYHQKGMTTEAMELYNEFLTIAKNRLGKNHRDVAMMLKCVAQIHHERKEYDIAKVRYYEALEAGRAALGRYHTEVASTLNKLGNLLYESGDFVEAVRVYQEGLVVERAILDVSHPNIVITLTNIGQIYKLRREYPTALRLYREALAIQRRTKGHSHPSTSKALSSIGLIYYQMQCYSKALDVYQEALRIQRDANGEINLDVASTLNSIGLVLFKLERTELAMQSFSRSLNIRRELLGYYHRDVAIILYNIATVYLDSGNEEDAIKYYNETLRVEEAALGQHHQDVLLTRQHIGQVHQQRGEFDKALRLYSESLEQTRQQQEHKRRTSRFGNQSTSVNDASTAIIVARTWNHMGNLYLQKGETAKMITAFAEAVRLLRSVGKSEDDLNVTGLNFFSLSKLHPECAAVA